MEDVYIKRLHIVWIGRIDLVTKEYDNTCILDHKTTTMLGATFYDGFELSQQTIGYCWAASKIYKTHIRKFFLNVLALRAPTKTGTSISFDRRPFTYTDEQLDEWEADTMTLVADFWSHTLRNNFPRSRVWCMGKYGACPYFDVCRLPNSQRREYLRSSAYTNVTWDPTI